jgi:putative ABC transport system permease protein
MLRSYIKIALRGLVKQKLYSFINVFGLAIAIAFCTLIFLFVRDEVTHDNFHEKADRLYRIIYLRKQDNGSLSADAMTPPPLGPAFQTEFPEVVRMARWKKRGEVVNYEGQSFRESIALADPDFFEMFSFPLIQGDPRTVLHDRNSVVLREEICRKYFGGEDPLGKLISIKMGSKFYDFIVSGIAKNIPGNSSITFDFLVSYDRIKDFTPERYLNQWTGSTTLTFVELRENASVSGLKSKFPGFIREHLGSVIEEHKGGDYSAVQFELQPLKDIYLNTKMRPSYMAGSNPLYSYLLFGIALLILIIAAINYTNLAVARSTIRLKEIGVRKVLGANKKKLMNQFLGEALFFSLVSLCLGIFLAEVFLPMFNSFVNKHLSMDDFSNWATFVSLVGLMFFVGLISGSYPALFLSRFRPAEVLRSRLKIGGRSQFSRWLVVVQFALSIFLIISTLVITHQLRYMRNQNLGFRGEQIVVIPTQGSPHGTQLVNRFRNELSSHKDVLNVSGSSAAISNDHTYAVSPVRFQAKQVMAHYFIIDHEFLKTMGLEVIQGRDFSGDYTADPQQSVIVNETLVKEMGWDSAIGKKIRTFMGRKEPMTVVGVVKDFHFESLHYQIQPAIFYIEPRWQLDFIYVKIRPSQIPSSLGLLEETWKKNAPSFPFIHSFLDEEFQKLYQDEERWKTVLGYTSVFAIVISCLGLFGLSALVIARRTKEIGIRKVLGASVSGLVSMVSMDFLKLILVANIIAWPLAYYAVNRWLQDFAFRIEIGIWIFLLAAVITAAIAVLSVSFQAIKAALSNPTESLRYE